MPALQRKGFTNIKVILGESEDMENEAIELVKSKPNRLYEYYTKTIDSKDLELLRHPENPLL